MNIGRALPPAAAPVSVKNIVHGIAGLFRGARETDRFTSELQKHFAAKYCFLVSSGKTALYCILKALHELYPEKDEVVVPAFNCYCVASAVIRAGLKVRPCDVDAATLDFSPPALATALDNKKNLLCVVPTHLFGLHAQVRRVRSQIDDPSVSVVEDAAQVMGCSEKGDWLGLQGDVGFFSLGRGKAFSTCEGGIIVTNNDAIGTGIKRIVDSLPKYTFPELAILMFKACVLWLFSRPSLFWIPKGIPFLGLGGTYFDSHFPLRSLSAFQAGMARGWEKQCARFRKDRNHNASTWVSFFANDNPAGCYSYANHSVSSHDLLRFPVKMGTAEQCRKILAESDRQGLGINITYPLPLNELPELASGVSGDFPMAKACAETLVTLPLHAYVREKDMIKIKRLLKSTGV
jgi:perosamine synthetase